MEILKQVQASDIRKKSNLLLTTDSKIKIAPHEKYFIQAKMEISIVFAVLSMCDYLISITQDTWTELASLAQNLKTFSFYILAQRR